MDRQVVFVKRFTGITPLQTEHKITYLITWNETGMPYGVGIEKTNANDSYEEFATHILNKRQDAEELALFLYENSVSPEHLHDILRDLKVLNYLD